MFQFTVIIFYEINVSKGKLTHKLFLMRTKLRIFTLLAWRVFNLRLYLWEKM